MVHGDGAFDPCRDERPAEQGQAKAETRVIESDTLFRGERTLGIRHGAELYTLRITRADKLILTK